MNFTYFEPYAMVLFWSTIISLKLYILVQLCRFALRYSAKRKRKLNDTRLFKKEIEEKLQKYQKEVSEMAHEQENLASLYVKNVEHISMHHKATASIFKEEQQVKSVKSRYSLPKLQHKPIPKYVSPNDSFSSNENNTSKTEFEIPRTPAVVDYENMLYMADSVGHIFHQIPFTEQDYLEAYEQSMAKNRTSRTDAHMKKRRSKHYKYPRKQSTKGQRDSDSNFVESKKNYM